MSPQRGYSLIDLMVGLFVGLLVTLSVYTTFGVVDAQRRAQVSGIGALETGIGGLFAIQHDVKAAGIGVVQNGQSVCPAINIYKGATLADGAAVAPVIITAGAENTDSDTITVAYSDSVLANNGIPLIAGMANPTSVLRTANVRGIAANAFLIVANPAGNLPCTLMQATGTASSGFGYDVGHSGTSTWNPPDPAAAFTNAPAYPAGSLLFNIGQFNWVTYRIAGGNLEAVNRVTNAVDVVASDVVQLKAWYGTSNGATAQIEQWVPATDAWAGPLDAAHVNAIRAIRLAAVARSQHPEKPSVVGGTCDATTTAPTSWPDGPTLDLTTDSRWRCYRYRVLTLVIPLKNVNFGASGA